MENKTDFIEDYPNYTAVKGEEYMGVKMAEHFKNKLNAWKEQLIDEVNNTVTHLKNDSNIPADPSDRASQEEDFALELRTRDRERKLIFNIDRLL